MNNYEESGRTYFYFFSDSQLNIPGKQEAQTHQGFLDNPESIKMVLHGVYEFYAYAYGSEETKVASSSNLMVPAISRLRL